MAEIFGFGTLIAKTFLMTMQDDIIVIDTTRYIFLMLSYIYSLRNILDIMDRESFIELTSKLQNSLFSHSVGNHITSGIA